MKEGTPYPKSGPLRDNKEAIKKHTERISKDATEWMFPKWKLHYDLTEEEHDDVSNFAEHASKRLAAGAVTAPISHQHIQEGNVDGAIEALATNSHDLWHAAVRYSRTSGESLVPAYMQASTELEQSMHPEALVEEMTVDLFEPDGPNYSSNILNSLRIGNKPDMATRDLVWPSHPEIREMSESIADLRESDPGLHFAKLHMMTYLANLEDIAIMKAERAHKDTEQTRVEFRRIRDSMLQDPDAEYLRLARKRYESVIGDTPDPRFVINEFRSMTQPLLLRLRLKKKIEKLSKMAT